MTGTAGTAGGPAGWDTSRPPTPGELAEAGISHVTARSPATNWQWEVTLVDIATSTRATTRAATREDAMHCSWVALHRTLTERPTIERTTQ
jgi:hypothetical protein